MSFQQLILTTPQLDYMIARVELSDPHLDATRFLILV